MGGEWPVKTLGELTVWSSGGTPSKQNPGYWGGDIPWISAVSMKTLHLEDSPLKITPEGLEHGSRLADSGSVLLLVRGSELHKRVPIGITKRPLAFNQDVKCLTPEEGLLPEYLFYWLLGNRPVLLNKVEQTGIGAGKLDTDVVKRLPFSLPPLPEQRAIARILSALDDKIELNRRMNETLEAMARALFKSWFVDFDPVRAKMEGRDSGLPKHIAGLFPDRLVESELGEIPEGWETGVLGGFFEIGLGGAWGNDRESSRASLAVRCLRGIDCHNLAEGRIPDVPVRWLSLGQARDRRLSDGVILVEGSGSFCGRSLLWDSSYSRLFDEPTVYSNFCKRLDPLCTYSQAAVCWMQMRRAYRDGELQAFRTGTAFPNLDVHGLLANLPVVVPPDPVATTYLRLLEPYRRVGLMMQSRTLGALRDTLLPKLISGELRVDDPDRFLEEVVA